ncbi:LysR family transcriptional regulator [Streptomyces spinosirectus]|jgi:DNA-binding transcriptional LysR family regulator|uniref:LysR family transcriptional regulator n=1 Tax=Streptomyces TaxID=1883 RepID=UPI001C9DFEEA|nr:MULTISPECIES: LysR family transcriptional regulator [Streptomyces]MBY8339730.1 LysR family transcriptional regulator [Streptomyces plumbidurans]UIR15801.1 LysR family transcriptional regulator [Streptomyces spinosirectus]
MELRQMAVVVAVAEEGGFTAAARRLHVVQSAVSGTVRALEHELGARLFLRTTHRVTLTPAGRAFLSFARTALGAAEEARAAVALAQEELSGEVTVGVMQGLYAGLAPGLAAFHREHPGVAVRLRQAPADAIPRDLRDGTVDLAVVALDAARLRGLATRALAQEEMVLVTAAAEARLPERTVTLAEAVALPLVDFPLGWAIRTSVDRALRSAALERATTFEVNDVLGATDLVRHGLGVCILPASLAARFPDLSVRRFAAHAPTWRMRVVHPKGDLPPAVAELLRHIG